jgi:hypothetical protein
VIIYIDAAQGKREVIAEEGQTKENQEIQKGRG